jgi:hypothetical protein
MLLRAGAGPATIDDFLTRRWTRNGTSNTGGERSLPESARGCYPARWPSDAGGNEYFRKAIVTGALLAKVGCRALTIRYNTLVHAPSGARGAGCNSRPRA